MAIVSISEYRDLPMVGGRTAYVAGRPVAKECHVPSGVSAPSQTFQDSTNFIRVATDVAIHLNHNCDGAVATTEDDVLPANSVEFFAVIPGKSVAFRTV